MEKDLLTIEDILLLRIVKGNSAEERAIALREYREYKERKVSVVEHDNDDGLSDWDFCD